jgi:hypothetical protein
MITNLYIKALGKFYQVTNIAKTIEEANEICGKDKDIAVIYENDWCRIIL